MLKYLAFFVAALVGISVLNLLIVTFTGWSSSGQSIAQLIIASGSTGLFFVAQNQRLPTTEERRSLVRLSFAASWLVSVVLMSVYLGYLALQFGIEDLRQGLREITSALPVVAMAIILIISIAISYLSIWFGYGFLTRTMSRYVLTAISRGNDKSHLPQ